MAIAVLREVAEVGTLVKVMVHLMGVLDGMEIALPPTAL
jgi:hypothetical protein